MWEAVGKRISSRGGEILLEWKVTRLFRDGDRLTAVEAVHQPTGERKKIEGDYFFSTMPVQQLVRSLDAQIPEEVRKTSEGLVYRDFITVGLLVEKLKVGPGDENTRKLIDDTWIYIQEPDVQLGRLQLFNNWSPYLVSDPTKVWLGLEYFCNETDSLWGMPDRELVEFGGQELDRIGIIDKRDVIDGTVIRMPKTYPAYLGTYDRFPVVREYLDKIENLFLIGRNGMHRYNNQDHSMLTAMVAVDNIVNGMTDKSNIWSVNTEQEYHEEKGEETQNSS